MSSLRAPKDNVRPRFAMRPLCSMLVLFLFAVCASAQASSDQSAGPNVIVIQKKWRIEVRNPMLEKDPVKAMSEREKEERKRKATERKNEILREMGMPTESPAVPVPASEKGGRGISVTYVYEVKVSNTGEKGIRTLIWEYVFFESGTELEVGRRRFVSKVSISPGRTRNVVMRSALPPTGSIDARRADKRSPDQYSEQVVIQSVEYADGSVWQLTSN